MTDISVMCYSCRTAWWHVLADAISATVWCATADSVHCHGFGDDFCDGSKTHPRTGPGVFQGMYWKASCDMMITVGMWVLATDDDVTCTCATACSGWCVGRERNRVWQHWSACPLSYSPWSSAYAGWCCPWVSTVNIAGVMYCFCMMMLLPVKSWSAHWSLLCCVIIFLRCKDKSS